MGAAAEASGRALARVAVGSLFDVVSPYVLRPATGVALPHFILQLARLGKAACDGARTAFVRYLRFVKVQFPEAESLVPLPVSEVLMVRFLNNVAARCVLAAAQPGASPNRNAAGKALRNRLAKVGELFGSLFPAAVMNSAAVRAAARGMSPPVPAQEFNVSVALAVHIEMYALGKYFHRIFPGAPLPPGMSPVVTERARDVLAVKYMSMRGATCGRVRIDSFVSERQAGAAYGHKAHVLLVA